jgi:hypothetical protein
MSTVKSVCICLAKKILKMLAWTECALNYFRIDWSQGNLFPRWLRKRVNDFIVDFIKVDQFFGYGQPYLGGNQLSSMLSEPICSLFLRWRSKWGNYSQLSTPHSVLAQHAQNEVNVSWANRDTILALTQSKRDWFWRTPSYSWNTSVTNF